MSDTTTLTKQSLGGLPVHAVESRQKYINMMVYGDSGVGKTRLAGSADNVPELRPVLILDFEGGTESLVRPHPEVQQVRIENWTQMQDVYNELHAGKHGFQTVILDSLTEIQKFNMYRIMEELVLEKPEREIDVPSMREWGRNLEQMRKFVRAFRDLKMNSIFTALAKTDRDEKTGRSQTLPSLSGKLSGEVAAFLDVVAYYYTKTVQDDKTESGTRESRILLTKKTETIIAKDRTQTLPMLVQDPSMQTLYDYFNGLRAAEG